MSQLTISHFNKWTLNFSYWYKMKWYQIKNQCRLLKYLSAPGRLQRCIIISNRKQSSDLVRLLLQERNEDGFYFIFKVALVHMSPVFLLFLLPFLLHTTPLLSNHTLMTCVSSQERWFVRLGCWLRPPRTWWMPWGRTPRPRWTSTILRSCWQPLNCWPTPPQGWWRQQRWAVWDMQCIIFILFIFLSFCIYISTFASQKQ